MSDKSDTFVHSAGAEPSPVTGTMVVCPSCHYGFANPSSTANQYVCPRAECGHKWEAATKTLQQIHLPDRRRLIPELRVVPGAPAAVLEPADGESVIGREARCQLALDNLNVSRRHVRLVRQGDHVWVED